MEFLAQKDWTHPRAISSRTTRPMATAMNWHFNALPLAQQKIWKQRFAQGLSGWVLYGDTALALHLGHRTSVDFDFFSSKPFEPLELNEQMGWGDDILQAEPNTLTVIYKDVKLSFFGGLTLGVVAPPHKLDSCSVASLNDLGGCKLAALVNRVELKDYLDIAALLRHGFTLDQLLGSANAIYHDRFPIAACLKSLTWFDDPALADLPLADRHLLEHSALSTKKVPQVPLMFSRIA